MNRLLLLLLMIFILISCDAQGSSPMPPTPATTFPRQSPFNGEREVIEALIFGELVLVDGCLRITENDSGTSHLVIWPPGYSSTIEGEDILILDNLGEVVLHVGDIVRISGGETPIISSGDIEDLPSPEICPGRYWIVGDEIAVASIQSRD